MTTEDPEVLRRLADRMDAMDLAVRAVFDERRNRAYTSSVPKTRPDELPSGSSFYASLLSLWRVSGRR